MADKWIAIASAHTTADDRKVLTEELIQELADTYDPKFYAARINLEHIQWYKRFGDVLETKAEKQDGMLKLFAKIQPNKFLEEINAQDQAVYTSIEVRKQFAGTEKAYLVGLALTDNPASVGTQRIELSNGSTEEVEMINTSTKFAFEAESEKGLIAKAIEKFNKNPKQSKEIEMTKEELQKALSAHKEDVIGAATTAATQAIEAHFAKSDEADTPTAPDADEMSVLTTQVTELTDANLVERIEALEKPNEDFKREPTTGTLTDTPSDDNADVIC